MITKKINQIQRNFIWGSTSDKRKLHMVDWETFVGFEKNVNWEMRIGKCGGIPSGGKIKSHLSHIGRIEEKCCPYIRKHFL